MSFNGSLWSSISQFFSPYNYQLDLIFLNWSHIFCFGAPFSRLIFFSTYLYFFFSFLSVKAWIQIQKKTLL